jgi:hypothetical protein
MLGFEPNLRPVLWVILTAKLLVEIAALSLLGQLLLGWLIGARRQDNLVYRVLQTVTLPAQRVADILSPRRVLAQHRPLVALALLVVAWFGLTVAKIVHCLESGIARCLS